MRPGEVPLPPKGYPFITGFAESFAYAGYYGDPVQLDRPQRPTRLHEQMLFLRHANIPVSCDTHFLCDMTEQFDTKAAEIRAMFINQLEPKRTAEIRERLLAAGLPI